MNGQSHAIVVVTRNRLALLKECLEAITRQSVPYEDVIVVDNASCDGTAEYLGELKMSGLRVLSQKENLGGAGGFCLGLRTALERTKADWITLIDDDSILRPSFLQEISEAIYAHGHRYPAYAGVPLTGGLRIGHRRRVERFVFLSREKAVPRREYKEKTFPCDIASFCGLVVSRKAAQRAGLPRPDFFIWYDDTEYCLRLRKQGQILCVTRALIDHKASLAPEGALPGWKDYYGLRNRLICSHLHYGAPTTMALAMYQGAKAALLCAKLLAGGQAGESLRVGMLTLDALYDGLHGRTGRSRRYRPEEER